MNILSDDFDMILRQHFFPNFVTELKAITALILNPFSVKSFSNRSPVLLVSSSSKVQTISIPSLASESRFVMINSKLEENEAENVVEGKKVEVVKLPVQVQATAVQVLPEELYDFKSFELKSDDLRVYHYENILAFGDLLHRLHPLAGQGFNMVLRDIKILSKIINFKMSLGIQLDSSVFSEFEKLTKHHNYLFSNSINLIYEFFHLESKIKNRLFSKSIKTLGKNKVLKKFLIKTADTGIII